MIAVDTNVLVYAHRREASEHRVARDRLRALAQGSDRWAIPWPCVYEFFSVVTSPRIWRQTASTPQQAWAQLDGWFSAPALHLIGESQGFAAMLAGFVRRPRVRGPVVHDARIAAICVAHGVKVLLTRDREFSLFPELDVENPFA